MWPRSRVVLALGVGAATVASGAACNDTLQGTLSIVTGPDNAFTQDPKPTSLLVQLLESDGGTQSFPAGESACGRRHQPPQPERD